MNPQRYDYPSRRRVVYGTHGMVCASQPLAAQAGLDILKKGGNAVDAAISTAITLTVTEPTSNGLGSDTFALVWMKDQLYGLNGSGWSPKGISLDAVRAQGHTTMPERGWTPVNIPGAPSAWYTLSCRFGALPFSELFATAIDCARNGYPVSPTIARLWQNQFRQFSSVLKGESFRPWFDTFAQNGRTPAPGERWSCPDMADTLEELAATNCESFYRGALARKIDDFSRACGGYLRAEDLAEYEAIWVDPISARYKGYDVWELPPNGHGLVVLMTLNMLRNDHFTHHDDIETLHRQLEAMKLAFADGQKYITDPACMRRSVEQFLNPSYADARRAQITDRAQPPIAGDPACGGTVYLCTADGEGNMVSLIQSNYRGFGSGIVIPGTGISLNDRGYIEGLNLLSSMRLCSNVPAQSLIPAALDLLDEIKPLLAPGGRIYEQRACIYNALIQIPGVSAVKPQAAFYIFPKLDQARFGIRDDEQFALDFLREKHILVTHGGGFHWEKPDHFRIVFLPEQAVLLESARRLGEFLESYHQ